VGGRGLGPTQHRSAWELQGHACVVLPIHAAHDEGEGGLVGTMHASPASATLLCSPLR